MCSVGVSLSPPTLRAVARGDPKNGAWHKCRSLFCFALCLALRSAATSCTEMVTLRLRLRYSVLARTAPPYKSLFLRQTESRLNPRLFYLCITCFSLADCNIIKPSRKTIRLHTISKIFPFPIDKSSRVL